MCETIKKYFDRIEHWSNKFEILLETSISFVISEYIIVILMIELLCNERLCSSSKIILLLSNILSSNLIQIYEYTYGTRSHH